MKSRILLLLLISPIILCLFGCTIQNQNEDLKIGEHTIIDTDKGIPPILDDAISTAVKGQGRSYAPGETGTEGHIILATEENSQKIKAYTIASYGAFAFENKIFTKVSGSGAIPTIMIFSKDEDGAYSLLDYIEPMDGSEYRKSIEKLFPKDLHKRVLSSDDEYKELARQQENQAREYLKSIGIIAQVNEDFVEKELLTISTEASNILLGELTKDNSFLNNCPYWLGTREILEDGNRYIYETSQGKSKDNNDLVIFQKKKNGNVIEEYKYEIINDKPVLLGENS